MRKERRNELENLVQDVIRKFSFHEDYLKENPLTDEGLFSLVQVVGHDLDAFKARVSGLRVQLKGDRGY